MRELGEHELDSLALQGIFWWVCDGCGRRYWLDVEDLVVDEAPCPTATCPGDCG